MAQGTRLVRNQTLPIWHKRRDGVLNPVEISVGMTD
jgi:hypothetical protein